jgi:hypothetical protein
MRGCGRIERPAFPAPSDIREAKQFLQNSGEIAPRDRGFMCREYERATLSLVIARLDRATQYSRGVSD